jgi:ABC-type branched-subunit amino acid transport system ATPase component/ABC-type branched-subunit amino acid transport system permease subunit
MDPKAAVLDSEHGAPIRGRRQPITLPSWASIGTLRWITWLALACGVVATGFLLPNTYWRLLITLYMIYAILALSMDVIAGRTGQLSLGQAGFVALGAYGEAMSQTLWHLSPWAGFVIAIVVGAGSGVVVAVSVSKLRGFYLAMLTIGFATVIQRVIQVFPKQTGGAAGLVGFKSLSFPFVGTGLNSTYAATGLILVICVAGNIAFSGRYMSLAGDAVRDRVALARAIGVDVRMLRIVAFAVSASLAAASGALYASALTYISPDSFAISLSIFALVSAVIGGLATSFGPLVGTGIIYGFQQVTASQAKYSLLFYGILLMLVPLVLSRGVGGIGIGIGRRLFAVSTDDSSVGELAVRRQSEVESVLEVDSVAIAFAAVRAVDGVTQTFKRGEVVGVIGNNGAGKTTLLHLISGFYKSDSGSIRFEGQDITKLAMHERARHGLVTTFQHPQLLETESVRTNLAAGRLAAPGTFNLFRNTKRDSAAVRAAARELGIEHLLDVPVRDLPGGFRKVVELARSLLSDPLVLLLDEPAAGLAPEEVDLLGQAIQRLNARGVTLLICDHRLELVADVCDRVVLMHNGQILAEGTLDEVTSRPDVADIYLGEQLHEVVDV